MLTGVAMWVHSEGRTESAWIREWIGAASSRGPALAFPGGRVQRHACSSRAQTWALMPQSCVAKLLSGVQVFREGVDAQFSDAGLEGVEAVGGDAAQPLGDRGRCDRDTIHGRG